MAEQRFCKDQQGGDTSGATGGESSNKGDRDDDAESDCPPGCCAPAPDSALQRLSGAIADLTEAERAELIEHIERLAKLNPRSRAVVMRIASAQGKGKQA